MKTIDKRVLEVDFDNSQFEKNAQTSMKTLEQFEKTAQMKNASNGMNKMAQAMNSVGSMGKSVETTLANVASASANMVMANGQVAGSVDSIASRFSNLGIVGMTVLSNLTTSAMGLVSNLLGTLPNMVIQGGFNRALTLEQAKFTLQGILGDAEKVEKALNAAKESVSGTAYTASDAANAASVLVASGVTVEKGLDGVMDAIAGTTATVNGNYASIAQIFSTVASNGRLMTMQLRQFSAQGLNVSATLKNVFQEVADGTSKLSAEAQDNIRNILKAAKASGSDDFKDLDLANLTEQNINDMVSASLINFQAFSDALQVTFGDHAKDANKTFTGSLANIRAALARTGEMFFTDLIAQEGPLVNLFNNVRLAINGFNTALAPIAKLWSSTVSNIINNVNTIFHTLNYWFSDTIGMLDAIDEADPQFEWAKDVMKKGGMIGQIFATLSEYVVKTIERIKEAFHDIFPPKSKEELEAIGIAIAKIFTIYDENAEGREKLIDNIGRAFSGLFAVVKVGGQILGAFASITLKVIGALSPIGGLLLDIVAGIGDLLTGLSKAIDDSSIFQKITETIETGLARVRDVLGSLRDAAGKGLGVLYGLWTGAPDIFSDSDQDLGKVSKALSSIKDTASNATEAASGFFTVIDTGSEKLKNSVSTALSPTTTAINAATDALQKIGSAETTGVLENLGNVLQKAFGTLGDSVSKMLDKLFDRLEHLDLGMTLGRITTAIMGILQVVAMFNITKLINQFAHLGNGLSTFVRNLNDVKSAFGTFQGNSKIIHAINETITNVQVQLTKTLNTLKMGLIKEFAKALLMLAGALFILSLIEPERLLAAGTAFTALLAELVVAFDLLAGIKMEAGMPNIFGVLVGIGVAMLLLSGALAILNKVDYGKMVAGVIAITSLLAGLMIAMQVLSELSFNYKAMSTVVPMLIGFGIAVRMLAKAIKLIGDMRWQDILQGLGAVFGLLFGLTAMTSLLAKADPIDPKMAIVLISFGIAMKAIASAVKTIGEMRWQDIIQGVGSIAGLIAVLTAATRLIKLANGVSLIQFSVYLLAFGVSMEIFGDAIQRIGDMRWQDIVKGLGAVLALTVGLTAATNLIDGKELLKSGASFILIGIAIEILANALARMAKLSFEEIMNGLIAIGGAFAIFIVVSHKMKELSAGAMAISIVGGALIPLALALEMIAKIPTGQAVSSLALLAGSLVILYVAVDKFGDKIVKFAAVSSALLGISAAILILSLGLSMLATIPIGGVLAAFLGIAGGILALVLVSKLIQPFMFGLQSLVLVIIGVTAAVALFGVGMYAASTAIVTFFSAAQMIIQYGGPVLAQAIRAILDGIKETALEITDTFGQLFLGLATALHKYAAPIADELLKALVDIINTIANNIGPLAEALWNLGAALLGALWDGLCGIADIAWRTISEFFANLDIPKAIQDMFNAGAELLGGFFGGIVDFLMNNPITQFFGGIVDGIKSFLGIGDEGSGSSVTNEIGEATAQGYVDGVNSVDATGAGSQLSQEALSGITSGAEQAASTAAASVVDGFATGMANNTGSATDAGVDVGEAADEGAASVDFSDTAYQTILGYAKGLTSNSYLAEDAMRKVANNAKNAADDTLDIRSPSRVFMETGMYSAQGLALGLLNNISAVVKASRAVGNASNSSLANALNSWDSYGIDFDTTPTIRPVLDLTDIYAGVAQMKSLIGGDQIGGFATIGYNGSRNADASANNPGNVTYQLILNDAVYNDVPGIQNVVADAFGLIAQYRGMNHG